MSTDYLRTKPVTLHLEDQVGSQITIECSNLEEMFDIRKTFGAAGWTTGDPPPSGWILPLCMEELIDWSAIGGRQFTMDITENNEQVKATFVAWKNQLYRRREPPVTAKIRKKVVFYSRGAKGSDDESVVTGQSDGGVGKGFVRLIHFEGNGRPIIPLCDPQKLAAYNATKQKAA